MPRPSRSSRELLAVDTSIRALIQSLERLTSLLRTTALVSDVADAQPSGAPRPLATGEKRKLTLTPARRKALRVQGQYMGLLRGLRPRARIQAKAVAKSQGIAAALEFARKARNK